MNNEDTDIIIKFLEEKFKHQEAKTDSQFNRIDDKNDHLENELREDIKGLEEDLTKIKDNHLTHIYKEMDKQTKIFNDKLEEQTKVIYELKG